MTYNSPLHIQQPGVFELTNYKRPSSYDERVSMGFKFEQNTDVPTENCARYMDIFSKNGVDGRFVFSCDKVYKLI